MYLLCISLHENLPNLLNFWMLPLYLCDLYTPSLHMLLVSHIYNKWSSALLSFIMYSIVVCTFILCVHTWQVISACYALACMRICQIYLIFRCYHCIYVTCILLPFIYAPGVTHNKWSSAVLSFIMYSIVVCTFIILLRIHTWQVISACYCFALNLYRLASYLFQLLANDQVMNMFMHPCTEHNFLTVNRRLLAFVTFLSCRLNC